MGRRRSFHRLDRAVLPAAAMAAMVAMAPWDPISAEVVTLQARKDNTLYESPTGDMSNGAGEFLFAGKTAIPQIRRGLIAFDLASVIPAGSAITDVILTLNMSFTIVAGVPVSLHRATADWGEGGSDASGAEGMGAAAQPSDATWVHTFFDTSFWTSPGGDFEAAASATTVVDQIGLYTWGPTPEMLHDAQSWVDSPATNFGWVIVADESIFPTAKRFDSSQNMDMLVRPTLRVAFMPPAAGRIPNGGLVPGTPLTAEIAGGDLTLAWDVSCTPTDTDFAVYEGILGSFASHLPRTCSTAGAKSVTFTPAAASSYYLVVPTNGLREGSYGTSGDLVERPPSAAACMPQAIAVCP